MYGIPAWFVIGFLFILGSIIGSFLDVFISRFHTGKSINGRSHCTSCGHTLDWFELFPLFSYLFLRGRCRICKARIPIRLFWMEVCTGILFALAFIVTDSLSDLIFACVLIMLSLVITVYDIKHFVIPNAFVALTGLLSVGYLAMVFIDGHTIDKLIPFVVSGLIASSFYGSLWLVSKGQWIGLGDAKLALPLAMMLTAYQTFSFVVLSFWVGAVISVVLLFLQYIIRRGQTNLHFFGVPLTIKSEVPFAPFLLVAFILVFYFNIDVLSFFAVAL